MGWENGIKVCSWNHGFPKVFRTQRYSIVGRIHFLSSGVKGLICCSGVGKRHQGLDSQKSLEHKGTVLLGVVRVFCLIIKLQKFVPGGGRVWLTIIWGGAGTAMGGTATIGGAMRGIALGVGGASAKSWWGRSAWASGFCAARSRSGITRWKHVWYMISVVFVRILFICILCTWRIVYVRLCIHWPRP